MEWKTYVSDWVRGTEVYYKNLKVLIINNTKYNFLTIL